MIIEIKNIVIRTQAEKILRLIFQLNSNKLIG